MKVLRCCVGIDQLRTLILLRGMVVNPKPRTFEDLLDLDVELEEPKSDKPVCWVCAGTGGKNKQCPECNGTGYNPRRLKQPKRLM